jgi:hypothetical protein
MPKVRLSSLYSILNDEIDRDELYLKFNGKKIWPENKKYISVGSDEKVDVDVTLDVPANEQLILELWDHDTFSRNDHLGSFHMIPDEFSGGPYSCNLRLKESSSTASYILNWEVL